MFKILAKQLQGKEYKNGDNVSYEEYELITKNFEGNCEYIDGKIYMFAGENANHDIIKNRYIWL